VEIHKKEDILLDAVITNMISCRAFHAELANGHEVVAILSKRASEGGAIEPGDTVQVRMSPYDMSKGLIIGNERNEI
jgi:translation initiation factor IF-1